jgi:hypothetical protein
MDQHAEAARSILACPADVDLVVDGVPHALADGAVGLQDWAGVPTFVCSPDSALARAGGRGLRALLTATSATSRARLVLAGRLRPAGTETCTCCDLRREYVAVDLARILLTDDEQRVRVALEDFSDPALELNRGFLSRTLDHLNDHHAEHLRHAVARRTGLPAADIAAACLTELDRRRAELRWVTETGAHRTVLRFDRAARSADELGAQLRRSLHPELC